MGAISAASRKDHNNTFLTHRRRTRTLTLLFLFALAGFIFAVPRALAEENYTAEFRTQQKEYRLGEPVFCAFVFKNTGDRTLVFSYRFPTRALSRDLPNEPVFVIKDSTGKRLPDPAPHPCGGAKGTVVYGTVTLPPGHTHIELWLLDQWARFTRPGKYTLAARRRIALKTVDPKTNQVSDKPVGFAVAQSNLTLEVLPSTPAERAAEYERDGKLLTTPGAEGFAEAYLVATTLPQPQFLDPLKALARAPAKEMRWDPQQALEGLARLGTRPAWDAILDVARDANAQDPVRAYAVLLLGEKADPAYVPPLVQSLPAAPESLRDDILRALGFFRSPRANQVLFDQLHSTRASDRVNALLGLRNLQSKDAVPAMIASLDDPDDQVRQVANFALEGLTGQRMKASSNPKGKASGLAKSWHDWWLKNEGNIKLVHAPACHDW